MTAQDLKTAHIVLTVGHPREDIDGVRHYANRKRPENDGCAAAALLAARGAKVTVFAPSGFSGISAIARFEDGRPLVSAQDLMDAVAAHIHKNACDVVLCFASPASIRPAARTAHKLKIKAAAGSAISLEVTGNIDIAARAKSWGIPAWGYDVRQKTFSIGSLPNAIADILAHPPVFRPEISAPIFEPPMSSSHKLAGKKIVVTSGPTEEPLTPSGDVITNFSTGLQGREIARALAAMGAKVTYIAGPSALLPPKEENIEIVQTTTAKSMLAACKNTLPADVFIGVAAVADFGCASPEKLRIAENETHALALTQNPDILETIGKGSLRRPALVIGFAAETDPKKIVAYAQGKLAAKGADIICANLVGHEAAYDKTENQIIFIKPNAPPEQTKTTSKSAAALRLAEEIAALYQSL